jgi:diguanylate cyclase (GGDEF)-like protein
MRRTGGASGNQIVWPVGLVTGAMFLLLSGMLQAEGSSGTIDHLLDEIRTVSYTRHWREAQAMLDEIADDVETFSLRQQAEFHLLEARHLTLDDRSQEALERAGVLLEQPLDDDQHLRTLQFAANVAVLLREYESAFEYLLEAMAVERGVDDPAAVMDTYNMAGYMFGRVGEHDRALAYGERAVALSLELGDQNRECVARQRLAPVFKWAEMYDRAEREYREGIEVCGRIGNELFVGVLKHGLADQLRNLGQLDQARMLATRSVELLEESAWPLGEYEARLVLAEVLHDLGDEEAWMQQDLEGIAGYFGDRELWDQLARLENLLSHRAEAMGDYRVALNHLRHHLAAREQFLSHDRAMLLAYLHVEFDSRLKDQQIDLLAESARVARVERAAAEQQRRARTVILVLSAVLLVLGTIMLLGALRGRRHFRFLSRHDSLSGLVNQGWFLQRAESMLEGVRQSGGGACLVMADIDHFKRINDRYGHMVGDGVIGQTARRLKQSFGDEALIGRLGGEEFGVLMLTDSIDEVVECIQRFRQGGCETGRADDPRFTLSFGLTCLQSGDTLSDLRSRADQALYEAKRAGRDCYVIDSSSSSPSQP